jgi:hypothetical protein
VAVSHGLRLAYECATATATIRTELRPPATVDSDSATGAPARQPQPNGLVLD